MKPPDDHYLIDHMTPFQTLYLSLILLLVASFLTCSILVWKQRDFQPIRARKIWLSLLLNLGMAGMVTNRVLQFIFPSLHCGDTWALWIIFFSIALSTQLIRIALLYTLFLISKKATTLTLKSHKESHNLLRYRHFVEERSLLLLVMTTSLAISAPMLIAILMNPEHARIRSEDNACEKGAFYILFNAVYLPLFIAGLIYAALIASKLRNLIENFGIKQEFQHMAVIGFTVALFYTIFEIAGVTRDFNTILFQVIPALSLHYVTLISPWRAIWMDRSGIFDVITDKTSLRKKLLKILHSEKGFEVFKEFCFTEFSVENCVFWMTSQTFERKFDEARKTARAKVEKMKQYEHMTMELNDVLFRKESLHCSDWDTDVDFTQLEQEALAIYESFLDSASPLSLNISSDLREKAKHLLGRDHTVESQEQRVEKWLDVFVTVRKTVEELMSRDTFTRFVKTKEYAELHAHMRERGGIAMAQELGILTA